MRKTAFKMHTRCMFILDNNCVGILLWLYSVMNKSCLNRCRTNLPFRSTPPAGTTTVGRSTVTSASDWGEARLTHGHMAPSLKSPQNHLADQPLWPGHHHWGNSSAWNPILDTRISVRSSVRPSSITLRPPPLDSETEWTAELWSKTNLLNWQNYGKSLFFFRQKKIF